MLSRPLPADHWIQALADGGQWLPPPEWAATYSWMDQLPRPSNNAANNVLLPPEQGRPMPTPMTGVRQQPDQRPYWTDIPDWLQALNDDQDYLRSRVIESPYGGWGGGAMQARRRGLR